MKKYKNGFFTCLLMVRSFFKEIERICSTKCMFECNNERYVPFWGNMHSLGSNHLDQVGNEYHFIDFFSPQVGITIRLLPHKMTEPWVLIWEIYHGLLSQQQTDSTTCMTCWQDIEEALNPWSSKSAVLLLPCWKACWRSLSSREGWDYHLQNVLRHLPILTQVHKTSQPQCYSQTVAPSSLLPDRRLLPRLPGTMLTPRQRKAESWMTLWR